MFAWDIGFWFCCLNPRERSVLRSSAEALLLTLWVGVPLDLWNAFWLVSANNALPIREAFLSIYHLEIVTIVADETEIVVVRPIGGFLDVWVSWSLFLVTPTAACLDGCTQSRVN